MDRYLLRALRILRVSSEFGGKNVKRIGAVSVLHILTMTTNGGR